MQTQARCNAHHRTDTLGVVSQLDVLAEGELGVEMMQCHACTSKRLDQCTLDRAELITAAKIALDVDDQTIEYLGRVGAAIELTTRQQLRSGRAMWLPGFPR
jgi:hypothetical protein